MIYRITFKEELHTEYLYLVEMLQNLLNLRKSIIRNKLYSTTEEFEFEVCGENLC